MSNLWRNSSFFILKNRKAGFEEAAIYGIIRYVGDV